VLLKIKHQESRMELAFITPIYVSEPQLGYQLRLYQLQNLLRHTAHENVAVWDLARDGVPAFVNSSLTSNASSSLRPSVANSKRDVWLQVMRDGLALALHAWPKFSVRSLTNQQKRILNWIDHTKPSHVVLVHPYATELIPALRRRGVRVFVDCQNVESDLARQFVGLAVGSRERLAAIIRWQSIERWEQRFFPLADEVWMPSEIDVKRQQHVCGGRIKTRCVPNALDIMRFTPRQGTGSHDVVLPGSFGYQPNVVGAKLFRDQMLPIVRQHVPDARLVLLGRDPSGHAHSLQRSPDVYATGQVPDTRPYLLKAGVVIAPILQGGGTRYKILEALALGLPVVTTPLGCEGLAVRDGEHLLIRDLDQFAPAVTSLLNNPDKGSALGRRGRRLVVERYSWDAAEIILRQALHDAGGAS
jgi:polysaccharide biosynthesis protein PslH